ncbi:MAG: DUF262 domain-containing HNH endonuclease family protein [Ekhidna sp.]|nr:DUF262 domain-containing HNH endonuclease family protein [Ekhidna sp.]
MEKKTLSNLLEGKIFRIPDYQRGYAWEEKQWKDFVQDIDALIDDKIISHYTGTIVIYQPKKKPTENYGTKKLEVVYIVDGQQRLTTCSLYLAIILNELINKGEEDFKAEIPIYLLSGAKSKLRLNNDTADFFFDLISKGSTNVNASTVHQKRLLKGYNYLRLHIDEQLEKRGVDGIDYLKDLFDAIIRKLNFSFYPIEVESEIGMTFELMNSRGKDLSSLELLKNYLMYWVYRNVSLPNEKEDLTTTINKSWKEVYINIANCNGSENQCLRIAWTLYHSCTPKHWNGYTGFKANDVIPLRDFSKRTKKDTQNFISTITSGLAEISMHYSAIIKPSIDSKIEGEFTWLTKIKNSGNVANYLPLTIAVRKGVIAGEITSESYIELLKALELFSYRVFLWAEKRSNAGLSKFYRWADDISKKKHSVESVTDRIFGTINGYSNENSFRKELQEKSDWYHLRRRLLRYTLYEYELCLLKSEGKGAKPKLAWSDLTDATFEHILPQNPTENSEWKRKWSDSNFRSYLHDISNIVLTKDNSHYLNFDFNRKKGNSGAGHCYANSDIRQERKISEFEDWTADSCKERRKSLISWIIERWGINKHFEVPVDVEEIEEEEMENVE